MAMRKITPVRLFQYVTRFVILFLVTDFAVLHQLKGVLGAPNAHVFCPFGGLESLFELVAAGGYIKKIFPATMILLLGTVLLTLALNRAFCGWICPLGTLQMAFDRLGRFFKIKKIQVPAQAEKYLGYLKYVFLFVIVFLTWRVGELVYAPYDPWAAYTHLTAGIGELYGEFLIGSLFLLVGLVGSLWIPNNFCRYFCPMGAFLSILAKFSPTKIQRNQESCINCSKCDRVCPVQLPISTEPAVTSTQCLSCGDCIAACPVKDTLDYQIQKKFPVRWLVYGIAALLLFFVPVLVAKQGNLWKTNFANVAEVLVDESGNKDPMNIKGSMTLAVVAHEFGFPLEDFFIHFNLPTDTDPNLMIKEIAHPNNLEVEDFRAFIAGYLQPGTAESEQAVSEPAQPEAHQPASAPEAHDTAGAAVDIRGRTTFEELHGFGMTDEQFQTLVGVAMPADKAMRLKDFADANGLEMDAMRATLIDALQP